MAAVRKYLTSGLRPDEDMKALEWPEWQGFVCSSDGEERVSAVGQLTEDKDHSKLPIAKEMEELSVQQMTFSGPELEEVAKLAFMNPYVDMDASDECIALTWIIKHTVNLSANGEAVKKPSDQWKQARRSARKKAKLVKKVVQMKRAISEQRMVNDLKLLMKDAQYRRELELFRAKEEDDLKKFRNDLIMSEHIDLKAITRCHEEEIEAVKQSTWCWACAIPALSEHTVDFDKGHFCSARCRTAWDIVKCRQLVLPK